MKLAFCLFNYFPYGGLQRDFLHIARECQRRGHEVHVFTMRWEGAREEGLHLHLIPAHGWQNHTRIKSFIQQVLPQLAGFDAVVGFNKMPGLDVYYGADVCYAARIRQKHPFSYHFLPRSRYYHQLEKAVFAPGAATDILLISPHQAPAFQHYYHTEAERMHLLPPGIVPDRKASAESATIRAATRKEWGIPDEHLVILALGSGFKTKGLDRTINAFTALSPALRARCHLWVIGKDNPQPFLKLAEKAGIAKQIVFLGGRPDVTRFLFAADLLIHPAYHENTGTVLLEAIVAGLPVLTVDVCGYAHYVQQANAGCVLSSPFNQAALNTALETMLHADKSNWQQNGITFGRKHDVYNMPIHAANHIENYQRRFYLRDDVLIKADVLKQLTTDNLFQQLMQLKGEQYRAQKGRLTSRVRIGDQDYFIKQHFGVGWKEIIKNLLQGRLPILGAKHEWLALNKLHTLGIPAPKPVAYGKRGINPAKQQSFVLMQALDNTVHLEDLFKQQKVSRQTKQALLQEVARIARVLHTNGMNHRDFYLCHFLLPTNLLNSDKIKLYLLDLHRALQWQELPERWCVKDLAGLYFSSKDIGLTERDCYRFMCAYRQQALRDILRTEQRFWQKVKKRGEQLYSEHHE